MLKARSTSAIWFNVHPKARHRFRRIELFGPPEPSSLMLTEGRTSSASLATGQTQASDTHTHTHTHMHVKERINIKITESRQVDKRL